MAQIGLSEAARLVGKNQSTIHRAMKAGRLSYTTGPAGERRIDTAELARVFAITIRGRCQPQWPGAQRRKPRRNGAAHAEQRRA
jgi:hypothetical protein